MTDTSKPTDRFDPSWTREEREAGMKGLRRTDQQTIIETCYGCGNPEMCELRGACHRLACGQQVVFPSERPQPSHPREARGLVETTLGDALPQEMTRVCDEVIPIYQQIGSAGLPALIMMRASIDSATKALAEGDIAAMIKAYEDLKGYHA